MSDDIKCNIFKPSDFHGKPDYHLPADMRDFICELANDKLDKLIEAAPTVYGDYKNGTITCAFGELPAQSDTHSAKLLFIEPIVKVECKHEPSPIDSFNGRYVSLDKPRCKYCNIELTATWSVKGV